MLSNQLLAEHFPNMYRGAVATRYENAGMSRAKIASLNNGLRDYNIHPGKFSFYFYEIKQLAKRGGPRPEPRQTIPRIKFYDNPKLKGPPAVTIREDGLYKGDVRKCGLYKADVFLDKNELKVFGDYYLKKQFYVEKLLILRSYKKIQKCMGNKYEYYDRMKKCPELSIDWCAEDLPSVTEGFMREVPHMFNPLLVYADEYRNGVAKITAYVQKVMYGKGDEIPLDKPYYFRPSDYGLFSVQPPSHILVKQFFEEHKVLIPLRDKLLACAAKKDIECILKLAPIDKNRSDDFKFIKEQLETKEGQKKLFNLVLKLNYKNGNTIVSIDEGRPYIDLFAGDYVLSLKYRKDSRLSKAVATISKTTSEW